MPSNHSEEGKHHAGLIPHMKNTCKNPGKRHSRWKSINQSASGPCYCPKCGSRGVAGESSRGAGGEERKVPPNTSLPWWWTLHWVSQRWKGRRELSTGRAEEFLTQAQLFHLLSVLMTRLQNTWWIVFPFTFHPTASLQVFPCVGRAENQTHTQNYFFVVLTELGAWGVWGGGEIHLPIFIILNK